MMNKVIYIKYSPLTRKVYYDFCMYHLIENNYSVEYWDISDLYSFTLNDFESYSPDSSLVIRTVKSYKQLDSLIAGSADSFYISLMTPGLNQIKLLRKLTKYDCKFSFWGPDPVFYRKNNLAKRINRITFDKLQWFAKHLLSKILFRIKYVHNYNYHFNVGKKGYQALGAIGQKERDSITKLQLNSFDYNKYVYHTDIQNNLSGNYIVFIDQYYPFHPDMVIIGRDFIPAEPYFGQLNKTFATIEKITGMRVVIAAHPKSMRYKDENFFNGRSVYFGQTSNLVKNAKLVISHDSTAISFAIMSYKPIVLLYSSLIKQYYPENSNSIFNLSNQFYLSRIDMGDEFINSDLISYTISAKQKELYYLYIYKYCTDSSLGESNEILLVKYLKDTVR